MSSANRLYVLGGRQKYNAHGLPEWQRHGSAMIVEVDAETGAAEVKVEYRSPPEVCPDEEPSSVFKAGTVDGNRLYVCTQTEVLVYELPDFEIVDYVTLPRFNDLHHVRPTADGTLLAAITGLDMVAEFDLEGEVLREWSAVGGDPWRRFSRDVDYRKVPTTKPHESHPNFVFQLDDDIWVTRFEQRDAISLTGNGARIAIDVQRPHDGMVHGDRVYFTTVDGHVVVADAASKEVLQVHDLNEINGGLRYLGWCRGLHVVGPDLVVVGFSRLRPTRIKANLDWTRGGIFRLKSFLKRPARIALYDLRAGRVCWQHNLEKTGLSVIFSVLDAPRTAG